MAKIACLCLPYVGHFNPMAAIAHALTMRGHSVTFFHIADLAPLAAAGGCDFQAVGRTSHPIGWLQEASARARRIRGLVSLSRVIADAASITAMFNDELPALIRSHGIDLILTDQLEAAGGMVAYHLGLPFISVAAALPLNWEPDMPPTSTGWRHHPSRLARYRNIAMMRGARSFTRPIDDVLCAYSDKWHLGRGRGIQNYMSGLAQVAQLVPSLDFPRKSLIGCFHYCGPFRKRSACERHSDGANAREGAFASFGTLQGHRYGLFETIAKACADNTIDLTIAHAGLLSDCEIDRLAKRATLHAFVDHEQTFARVQIAIAHGGLNTVLDALAQGVPLVLIPLAFEQRGVAARVAGAGAGLVLRRRGLREGRISAALREVLSTTSYRDATKAISREIASHGGAETAADIVERLLQTGRPVLAAHAR